MAKHVQSHTVLVADDSPDDCLIAMRAWEESTLGIDVQFVHDGRELLDYLYRRRKYRRNNILAQPHLILLDLNMPRKDGRKFLVELKSNPAIRHIPVVVFSNSTDPQDIQIAETLGAYDFITKPDTFKEYQQVFKELSQTILNQEVLN